jgi:hypothetical protein
MARKGGLWIAVDESEADSIDHAILEHSQFTRAIASAAVSQGTADLCIVSLGGENADYLGISRTGGKVATGQRRLTVSRNVQLNIPVNSLKQRLPRRYISRFPADTNRSRRISPGLWDAIFNSVMSLKPRLADELKSLKTRVVELNSPYNKATSDVETLERDAVATAIQAWGGVRARKRILRSASTQRTTEQAPFLSRLSAFTLLEDSQIVYDAAHFPGMEVAMSHASGFAVFENEQGDSLTVINCNRQPLERILGVDLIYYNHRYQSFVLVQYKRMVGKSTGSRASYRPKGDSNYEAELGRMRSIGELIARSEESGLAGVSSFRLFSQPFYFKLCEAKSKSVMDEGMARGLYIPLGLWDRIITSPSAKGPRDGIAIGWHNCPRHFSNTEFTSMLNAGWIGSTAEQSKFLGDLIGRVLEGDRMLVIAATSANSGKPDYLRDQLGQFASPDDPDAAR